MPRHLAEFGSALPGVAELQPAITEVEKKASGRRREQTPLEKAQLMWDVYQDIKTAWVDFARAKRSAKHKEDIESVLVLPRLRDKDNPLAQEFHATPLFQKLHTRLAELWGDEAVKEAWIGEMTRASSQWAEVNGSWKEYATTRDTTSGLEAAYDDLQKEKFSERGKTVRSRRRTLQDDLVDIEVALAESRAKADALFKTSPELAAKILASELKERRKEFHSREGFMWFRSRREILEAVEKILTDRETLRLIVLEGEAGTGKTTLAEMLARHFTDAPALHVEVGEKTKADRALFADEKLETGSSPTVYKSILYALTGKERPTDSEPNHDGRAVFIDEFNKLTNDEGGIVATILDRCRVGGKTGYHLLGANPDDAVQPKALVLAAQNPAGGRFRGRTDFTTEVKRKMEIVPVEYFPQTADNPELYEAFLVAMQDNDGRIRAKKEEVGAAWKLTEDPINKTKQEKLETVENAGGALWRLAQMLHNVYENLAHRPNTLARANPDAWIGGRVLPPGDIFKWLKEYQTEVKKGTSLEHFLSQKLLRWLETSFQSTADAGDKQLYLELAKKFGLAVEKNGEYKALPQAKIRPDFLTERQVAELSPRVPRKVEGVRAKEATAAEFPLVKFDFTDAAGAKRRGVEVRIEPTTQTEHYVRAGQDTPMYVVVGTIKECTKHPELVGQVILAEEARAEKKLIVPSLAGFEKKEREIGAHEIMVRDAKNPYHEAWAAGGVSARLNPERMDRAIDLQKILDESVQLYQQSGLVDWQKSAESADFNNLTPEKRQLVESLVKEGWEVIGVMPGREAQLKQLQEAMVKLKPLWVKDNKPEAVADPYLWNYINDELIKKKKPELIKDVPIRPYLLLTQPTQHPPVDTCNKKCSVTEPEQQNWLKDQQKIKPHIKAMGIGEYSFMQAVFTRRVAVEAPGGQLAAVDPLDRDTHTRFIDLPVSSGGDAPDGDWDPDDRRLRFAGGVAGSRGPYGGFRLSVRVEL